MAIVKGVMACATVVVGMRMAVVMMMIAMEMEMAIEIGDGISIKNGVSFVHGWIYEPFNYLRTKSYISLDRSDSSNTIYSLISY